MDTNDMMPADMTPVYIALGVLGGILIGVLLSVLITTMFWPQERKKLLPPLRGLLLPRGSIRALLAFLIVGAFIIFAFLGERALTEDAHFQSVLAAFGTLTGAVTGFYFGTRGAQTIGPDPKPKEDPNTGKNNDGDKSSTTTETSGPPGGP